MHNLLLWLEAHNDLAGWAQFFGAMAALLLTYFTAFYPGRRRKRQLNNAALRLLSHGYESIESYYRTSANFLPFPLSLRFAALTMSGIAEDINRFPVYELDDQGTNSRARHLVSTGMTLKGLSLFLKYMASDLENREATAEDQDNIREFVGERLKLIEALLSRKQLRRPEWPTTTPNDETRSSSAPT